MGFLPINFEECNQIGWNYVDIILVSGDAYVDHPSFGASVIARHLEHLGYNVAILAQPNCSSLEDFKKFNKPRLGFLVTSGNIDSMVAHYTVAGNKRKYDSYSEGGKAGNRPDRAVDIYCKKIRECYSDTKIVIGGLEASLRRFAHYDYWSNTVLPSILVSSGADILVYGMGEKAIAEIAKHLSKTNGKSVPDTVKGTCILKSDDYINDKYITLPTQKEVIDQKELYAVACLTENNEHDAVSGRGLMQRHGDKILVQHPPQPPISQTEFDCIYSYNYERAVHPSYKNGVPAIEEVEHSIIHNRGCFGACNFCSLAFHQGRVISSRSKQSVISEAERITSSASFKGYIHDVGGPTANFRAPSCKKQAKYGMCKNKKCLTPTPCSQLLVSQSEYLNILRELRSIKSVKRVFVRSGIRYDYLMLENDKSLLNELITHHVSGQLKVAPEHCSAAVLGSMGKPYIKSYLEFEKEYYAISKKAGKQQYLVPYFMSSHPGSTLKDAIELALFLKKNNIKPEQVQDFYPTPGTISTCMYYTGLDPYTMKPIYTAKSKEDKELQRTLLQYFLPKNKLLVIKALVKAGRQDLIGHKPHCLVTSDVRAYNMTQSSKAIKINKKRKK